MLDKSGYNGPSQERFFDVLAEYEEQRFLMMRAASNAGKILNAWEGAGGQKDDLRDAYKLRLMDPDDQKAELKRQLRVASWLGIVDEDRIGQTNFLKAFEARPQAVVTGIGGVPMGTRLSIVRAKEAGFNDGKLKNGPGLQEGLEQFQWEPDSEEALSYAEGFGEGLKLRPPPKARLEDLAKDDDAPPQDDQGTVDPALAAIMQGNAQEASKEARPRGRKRVQAEPPPVPVEDDFDDNRFVPRVVN